MEVRPFGLWPSPLSPDELANSTRLRDVTWDADGRTLVWLEGRGPRACSSARDRALLRATSTPRSRCALKSATVAVTLLYPAAMRISPSTAAASIASR